MGIQRFDWDEFSMLTDSEGDYVRFAHYEAEVSSLRAELAAKSKDAARWDYARTILAVEHIEAAYELCGHPAHVPSENESVRADQAIDIAMGEGNGR